MSFTYAFGDIHGCFATLLKLWHIIDPDLEQGDKVIFLGDYIDRGPDTIGVLRFIKSLTEKYPSQVIALKGNHEDMCVRYYKGLDKIWTYNQGNITKKAFNILSEDERNHLLTWMEELPERYSDSYFRYCHSGYWAAEQDEYGLNKVLWDRLWLRQPLYVHAKPTIFGHTPLKQVSQVFPGMYGIDTGCVYGHSLSVAIINNDTGNISFKSVYKEPSTEETS